MAAARTGISLNMIRLAIHEGRLFDLVEVERGGWGPGYRYVFREDRLAELKRRLGGGVPLFKGLDPGELTAEMLAAQINVPTPIVNQGIQRGLLKGFIKRVARIKMGSRVHIFSTAEVAAIGRFRDNLLDGISLDLVSDGWLAQELDLPRDDIRSAAQDRLKGLINITHDRQEPKPDWLGVSHYDVYYFSQDDVPKIRNILGR
jgi:hypothetical protein